MTRDDIAKIIGALRISSSGSIGGRPLWHCQEKRMAGEGYRRVGEVDLLTANDPPSPVPMRKAIVRLDRPSGHERRVLGIAYRGFQPVQNRDGALLFDAIFGGGKPVDETGGYLRDGQVVWLLAKIDQAREIAANDVVQPYALLANSHDGSMAFNIRLKTIRVVCQNTLAVAMRERQFGEQFRRTHQGGLR